MINAHTHTKIHTHTCVCAHTHTHACSHNHGLTLFPTHTHMLLHMLKRARTHTHTHTHPHTHTHTHTHKRGSAMMMRSLRSACVVKLAKRLLRTNSPGLLSGSTVTGMVAMGPLRSPGALLTGGRGGLQTGEAVERHTH